MYVRSGDVYSILLDWVENEDSTYSYLEFRCTIPSVNEVELELFGVTAGVEEALVVDPLGVDPYKCVLDVDITEDTGINLGACISKGLFYGNANSWDGTHYGRVIADAPSIPENGEKPGWRAGFRHQQSRLVAFHPWTMTQLIDDDPTCQGC
jgi:hypothetical protein